MFEDLLVVLCTCPDADTARTLAHILVEKRCAACVNILPGVTSVYRWQAGVETSSETLLIIKTHISVYQQLENIIHEHHPYEIPEVIALPIKYGLPKYLTWVMENIDDRGDHHNN